MQIYGVQPKDIGAYWPVVEPFIERPLVKSGVAELYDSDYIKDKISKSKMQCWLIHENSRVAAVGITAVDDYPKKKILTVAMLGAADGAVDDWVPIMDYIKAYAKSIGCGLIRVQGRKGWVRIFHPKEVRTEFDLEV